MAAVKVYVASCAFFLPTASRRACPRGPARKARRSRRHGCADEDLRKVVPSPARSYICRDDGSLGTFNSVNAAFLRVSSDWRRCNSRSPDGCRFRWRSCRALVPNYSSESVNYMGARGIHNPREYQHVDLAALARNSARAQASMVAPRSGRRRSEPRGGPRVGGTLDGDLKAPCTLLARWVRDSPICCSVARTRHSGSRAIHAVAARSPAPASRTGYSGA